nr:regulator of v-atpase in vacuolar membrane protein 1 [Quercus suber]
MPSNSPGDTYTQILPGAPTPTLQCVTSFIYRQTRYIAYISGCQLNILTGPTTFVQALTFQSELNAVLADGSTGNIALIEDKRTINILEPSTDGWRKLWWEKKISLQSEDGGNKARCLSWGSEGEVLVGGSRNLSLYSTNKASRAASQETYQLDGQASHLRRPLWSKAVASPVGQVGFSPNGGLIATTGDCDKLVKIWRRLSFEEASFDFCYLPHGGVVTHVEWRPLNHRADDRRGSGISGRHDDDPEVVYTIASDGMLRVWRSGGFHDSEIVSLLTTMDLVGAIPKSPSILGEAGVRRPARYACILAFDTFGDAVTNSIFRQTGGGQISHSLEHLKDIITKSPDVVLELDGQGRMSAWGFESIGHKRRPDASDVDAPFHIAHAEGLDLRISEASNATLKFWFEEDVFNLIVHDFAGGVSWWQGKTEILFSPAAAAENRLRRIANWKGQAMHIEKVRGGHAGADLVSWDANHEAACWSISEDGAQLTGSSGKPEMIPVEVDYSALGYETGISDPSIVIANTELVAMVSPNGNDLVVLGRKDNHIEHRQTSSKEVKHLAILSPVPQNNFLAIGYDSNIVVLVQTRYKQYHEHSNAWTQIKAVSVEGLGLDISAMDWLPDGRLVLAVGNGMLITNNHINLANLSPELQESLDWNIGTNQDLTISTLAIKLRQHLPLWHPELLRYMVYNDKINTAASLLYKLSRKLKFWSEGDDLQILGDVEPQMLINDPEYNEFQHFNRNLSDELLEQLTEKKLPMLSSTEQNRLKGVVEAIIYIYEHAQGLDVLAVRYLFEWKIQLLDNSADISSSSSSEASVVQMHWREIAFAHQSKTQQALIDLLILHYDSKITWATARALGLTAWISDHAALVIVFEALAQSAYRATDPPDPTNASLYFLALHKKPTLLGLWRVSTWHKEQRATINFLKRDFGKPDAKIAAKKNAYALMGKRRFGYAAAFFLLADDPASAVGVLASQCNDVMLAVAVARSYGTGIETLIAERLLPQASQSMDQWYTSWCHMIVSQPSDAALALIKPLEGPMMWWQDDPLTILLYRHLHNSAPHETGEYTAVLRAARTLCRMGLSLIALDLVENWVFTYVPPSANRNDDTSTADWTDGRLHTDSNFDESSSLNASKPSPSIEHTQQEPPSVLDTFASPKPTLDGKAARESKAAALLANLRARQSTSGTQETDNSETQKREPTQFKEPDANSLLDNFGL